MSCATPSGAPVKKPKFPCLSTGTLYSVILHQRRAGPGAGDLGHRTAHVHIDEIRAQLFHHDRSIGHSRRVAAENLNTHPPFFRSDRGELTRGLTSAVSPSELTISVMTRPQPPSFLTRPRKARSV